MSNPIKRRQFLQHNTLAAAGFFFGGISLSSFNTLTPSHTYAGVKKRRIGTLQVSSIGLGCMSMAGVYNVPQPKAEMIKIIQKAVENGVDFFDTAEVYGPFYSEEIVGEALKPYRNKVNIASKFGFDFDGARTIGKNSKPAHIRKAVEGMLKRLQTDRIDLLYLHRVDGTTAIEEKMLPVR